MLPSRPRFVVAVQNRRKRTRILTLKNLGWALLVAVVAFIGVDYAFHMRTRRSEDYGRLFQRHIGTDSVVASRAPAVVTEAPVPDQTAADPLLLEPAARSQYLGTTTMAPPAQTVSPAVPQTSAEPLAPAGVRGDGVAIVGDSKGVSVATPAKDARPKLSGGIFR
jgi:hypothetical protein